MLQHFFIEGQYMGATERLGEFVHAQFCGPQSFWFLCPCCGELWAKVAVDHKTKARWSGIIRNCRKCGGGSMLREWDEEYSEALPFQVLLREFKLELTRQGFSNVT